MKRFILSASLGALAAGCGGAGEGGSAAMTAERPAGDTSGEWVTLFDGSSLDRWSVIGDANWRIEGDTVRADASTGASFLVSDADYADFELELEFWVDVPANSGVFLRCQDDSAMAAETCYEINIFDSRPDPTYRTGSVVNYAAPAAMVNTGGRWNQYLISAEGDRLRASLNGVEMFDIRDGTHASGPLGLQYGSGVVIFRNVRIRTL